MPSDSNGNYSLPPGYLAEVGETIQPSQHNPPLEDIRSGLTARLMRSGAGPMTGPLKLVDGVVGTPALVFNSAQTTGLFKTANGFGVAISGTLVAEFGAGGILSGVVTASIQDKAVTLRKLYQPSGPSLLLGTDSNPALTITGAADNGAGLVRLAMASTATFATGQKKTVADVLGTTEANGTWTITVVDSTHIDLQGSAFANAYVSGGTIGGGVAEISMGAGVTIENSVLKASVLVEPQGRLTLSSGVPVPAADVTSSNVYYTPDKGNLISIWNGSAAVLTQFSELTLALSANHLANTIYDQFVINDAGTVRLVSGPAWNNSAANAGDRGSGAGTTELQRVNGQWTNKNAITVRYGATTLSLPANRGVYVGSILIDGSVGQVTCHRSYGQSRKWGVWNAYNRRRIMLKAGDNTASWSYTLTPFAPANSSATSINVFAGLPEEAFDLSFTAQAQSSGLNQIRAGVGWNSTSSPTGLIGVNYTAIAGTPYTISAAELEQAPALGVNVVTGLIATQAANAVTWFGTEPNLCLTAKYDA